MPLAHRLAPALIALLALAACKPEASAPANNSQAAAPAAPAAPAAAPAPSPSPSASTAALALEPLSDDDQIKLGTGCSCSFVSGNDTLIEVANAKAMIRVGGKLEICPITEAQETALAGGTGSFECGGYKIAMKGKGPVEQGENDDSGRDATITVTQGAESRSYDGAMACAC